MILCDTSVIVGAINSRDHDHVQCVQSLQKLRHPPISTHACIVEAMHLLKNFKGWAGQEILLSWIENEFLRIYSARPEDDKRACALMRQYADAPMDYADAMLVTAAESLGTTRILTLDRHFYAYRINDTTPFEILS